ncbi:MAG: hypothetical protein M0R68_13060 [Bacteroidetes bacterium]|nr:hypothetical protein [Bacteroidota bacterium]
MELGLLNIGVAVNNEHHLYVNNISAVTPEHDYHVNADPKQNIFSSHAVPLYLENCFCTSMARRTALETEATLKRTASPMA